MGKRAAVKASPKKDTSKRVRNQSGRRLDKTTKVERFMRDYINGKIENHIIQTHRVNSLLIREAVGARLDLDDSERPLGRLFANELLEQWGAKPDLFAQLDLPMNEPMSDKLFEALDVATAKSNAVRCVDDLVGFFQYVKKVNKTSLVGAIQTVYSSKYMSKSSKDAVWMAIMNHVAANGLINEEGYDEVLKAARPCFDGSLCADWCRFAARGWKWDTWLARKRDICYITLKAADVDSVLSNLNTLSAVAKIIARLHSTGGLLGDSLFKEPRDKLASQCFGDSIAAQIAEVAKSNFSPDSIAAMMAQVEDKVHTMQSRGVTKHRMANVSILGRVVQVSVGGESYERDLHLQCALRDAALGKEKGIPLLPIEEALYPELLTEKGIFTGPQHLITGIVDFRTMFAADIITKKAFTLEKQITMLRLHWDTYVACNRYIVIERAFMESAQSLMDDKVSAEVLAVLPDEVKALTTPDQVAMSINEIRKTERYKLTSDDLQQQIQIVGDSVNLMRVGAPPSADLAKGASFTKSAYHRFQHFLRHEVQASDGVKAETLSGSAAMARKFKDMEARITEMVDEADEDDPPTLADLQIFTEYDFLIDRVMSKKLEAWMKLLVGGGRATGTVSLVVASASVEKASSSKGPSTLMTPTKLDTSKAELLKIFKPRIAPK
jgi:hypothetical protein